MCLLGYAIACALCPTKQTIALLSIILVRGSIGCCQAM